jgi:hypothetical protein
VTEDLDYYSHYTYDSGATLVRIKTGLTVYAIDNTGESYVGIPSQDWIPFLGFIACLHIDVVEEGYLNGKTDEGIIRK